MKKLITSVFVFAMVVAMTSCGSSHKVLSSGDINGEWKITEAAGVTVIPNEDGEQPFMAFNVTEDRMYGYSGCNRMNGIMELNIKTSAMKFRNVASTRMACPDMKQETLVLGEIEKVASYYVQNDGSLIMRDNSGKIVMRLIKK